jgi:hypothetical protein
MHFKNLIYMHGMLVDWKTYDVNPVNSSGKEKRELLANLFLANHRYTRDEATLQ